MRVLNKHASGFCTLTVALSTGKVLVCLSAHLPPLCVFFSLHGPPSVSVSKRRKRRRERRTRKRRRKKDEEEEEEEEEEKESKKKKEEEKKEKEEKKERARWKNKKQASDRQI